MIYCLMYINDNDKYEKIIKMKLIEIGDDSLKQLFRIDVKFIGVFRYIKYVLLFYLLASLTISFYFA
jgi:hypothetical protein